MQNAKRMVLVDERLLEGLKTQKWQRPIEQMLSKLDTKHQLSWRRPTDTRAKTTLVSQMKSILDDGGIPDDVKVKQFNQTLTRFRQTKTKMPEEEEEEADAAEDEVAVVPPPSPPKIKTV